MKIRRKLLVEQAWDLQLYFDRHVEIERKRLAPFTPPASIIDRLKSLQIRAYSRYVRRLNQFWA